MKKPVMFFNKNNIGKNLNLNKLNKKDGNQTVEIKNKNQKQDFKIRS